MLCALGGQQLAAAQFSGLIPKPNRRSQTLNLNFLIAKIQQMSHLLKFHVARHNNDSRYAHTLENLYLELFHIAQLRIQFPPIQAYTPARADVLVLLLSGQADQDKTLMPALKQYIKKGAAARPVVAIRLHDHPDYGRKVKNTVHIPKPLSELLDQKKAQLYDWTNKAKIIQNWIGGQPAGA